MIGVLGRGAPPDEGIARRALAAVPYPVPDLRLLRLGDALLGIATRPDFVDESLSCAGDLIAAISGRIDNAADLARELTAAGTPPRSDADADVLVALVRARGPLAWNRLRGAFAALVTDGRTLWCVRDHIGFRPLFHRDTPAAFVAAGESRQVAVATALREEPDLEVLELILFGGQPTETPAALKGVERLGQGMVRTVPRDGTPTTTSYWDPLALIETARLAPGDVRDRFLELLAQAAARSLTGRDVVLLSGGLDSPTVAAYAAPEHLRRHGRPLGGLTAVFPDLPEVDESRWTQLVADRFGMELHTFRPSAKSLDDAERWARDLGTAVPTLSVPEVSDAYRRARSLGYGNVMTGEFAEMIYGNFAHAFSHLLWRGRLGAIARLMRAEHARGFSRWFLTKRLLAAVMPGRLANWYFERKGLHGRDRIPAWIDHEFFKGDVSRGDFMGPPRDRWRMMQVWGTEGSTLTMEVDAVVGYMAGVTVRRPLADVDLWEFFLSLPLEVKFPVLDYKAMAKRMLRGVVPDEIIDRRKTYFNAHMMAQIDYPALRRLLAAPRHRFARVDYDRLAERLERQDLDFYEWIWARELARVHAFLAAW